MKITHSVIRFGNYRRHLFPHAYFGHHRSWRFRGKRNSDFPWQRRLLAESRSDETGDSGSVRMGSKLVWDWYRERRQRIRKAQPNPAHRAIANLALQADEFLLVTQNVDDLQLRAGLPAEKMVQIHGDIFMTRCSRCDFRRYEHEHDDGILPKCPQCSEF